MLMPLMALELPPCLIRSLHFLIKRTFLTLMVILQTSADLAQEMPKVHWAGLAHSPWDHASEPDFWQQLREKAIYLRENTDKALMIVAGCNLFEWGTFLRRLDNFLMDLLSRSCAGGTPTGRSDGNTSHNVKKCM